MRKFGKRARDFGFDTAVIVACLTVVGCGDDDGLMVDAGVDAVIVLPDSALPDSARPDSATRDAAVRDANPRDATPRDATPPDSGPRDATLPDSDLRDATPPDSGPRDATPSDSGPRDSGPRDSGPPDSATIDAGMDTGTDAAVRMCGDLGGACISTAGCPTSAFCQTEILFDFGGTPPETIVGLPAGTDTTGRFFENGYCTPDNFSGASLFVCDPDDDTDTTCGDCGRCIDLGQDTMCALDCVPTATDNSGCRDDGYACDLNLEVCFPGCNSDAECRIARQETNGIAGLQTPADCPADCGGVATNFDRLIYDTTSDALCSAASLRCEFSGLPGATAGDMCTLDTDCEANGDCLNFTNPDGTPAWPGNYCTKFRCDIAGRGCASGGKCQERGFGAFLCVDGCTVGTGPGVSPADASTWRVAEGGCRDGYSCNWDGIGAAGAANNGGCVPGEFNAVASSNIGDPCVSDDECWSPFGRGFCIAAAPSGGGFVGGYCSVRDCGSPGLPTGICGATGGCVTGLDAGDPSFGLCMEGCSTPADCNDGYGCVDPDGGGALFCFPSCLIDADCKTTQRCAIPAPGVFGECIDR